MKAFLTKFDKLMAAITFAEADTPQYCDEFLGVDKTNRAKKVTKEKHAAGAACSEKRAHAGAH